MQTFAGAILQRPSMVVRYHIDQSCLTPYRAAPFVADKMFGPVWAVGEVGDFGRGTSSGNRLGWGCIFSISFFASSHASRFCISFQDKWVLRYDIGMYGPFEPSLCGSAPLKCTSPAYQQPSASGNGLNQLEWSRKNISDPVPMLVAHLRAGRIIRTLHGFVNRLESTHETNRLLRLAHTIPSGRLRINIHHSLNRVR
jgi:hypothetical protein